ncbi:MAG: hypothetical protein JNM00_04495, partial [Flavobacteriales bacterium]|nr:hypothetical protein [Flavobacteriales bacterium]
MHHLRIHSSDAANAIWNSGFGGALGSDNNCAFWGFFPDLQHDSYVSIGATSSPADACPDCVGTQGTIFQITNPAGQIATTFAPGGGGLGPDLTVSDGSWFIPNDGSCNGFGQAPDNRILLAQVTIPSGTLEYWLNIAIFDEAIGANQLIYVHTQQEPPQFVGAIPEIDGNCIGLVFPLPLACSAAGCTDPVACNYDPAALVDDGSCTYPGPQPGFCDASGYADLGGACATSVCSYDSFCCTNSWDSLCASEAATDANCAYCVTPLGPLGCTDPGACNYDAAACGDNGTCTYPDGCTDANACNYNAFATCDDGSCIYEACDVSGYSDLAGACATSVCSYDSWCCTNSWDSLCASEAATDANCAYCVGGTAVVGCTDPLACNYNAGATCDDGSCIAATPSAGINCNETGYADLGGACATSVCSYDAFCCNTAWDSLCASEAATDANCAYCLTNASGCTDPAACNYNDLAGCDDGSCTYPDGCTDAAACNYNPAATCNDGSCVYEACDVAGYSDLAGACATSVCSYDSFCCNTSWDSLCAGEAATDANCAYCVGGTAVLGCTDPSACNYDPAATCDDGSCIAGIATPDCDVSGYADLAGACATSVCSYDAFCCNTSWDSICANEAAVDVNCAYCLSSANSTGCTDTAACNYDAYAECSDGSCTYPGCTDAAACNYNAGAGCDDGSCVYPAANDACSGAEALALNSTVTADNSTACGENGPDPGCGGTGIID